MLVYELIGKVFVDRADDAEVGTHDNAARTGALGAILDELRTRLEQAPFEPRAFIVKYVRYNGNMVYQDEGTATIRSDSDVQYHAEHMSFKELDTLKTTVLSKLDTESLSGMYDLNVYIDGDVGRYPSVDVSLGRRLLIHKLRRYNKYNRNVEFHIESLDRAARMQEAYCRAVEGERGDDIRQAERNLYTEYFLAFQSFIGREARYDANDCDSAVALARVLLCKIEGYVCSQTLKVQLGNALDDPSEYILVAMENLCDAYTHMSADPGSLLDKSKYMQRTANALEASLSCNRSCPQEKMWIYELAAGLKTAATEYNEIRKERRKKAAFLMDGGNTASLVLFTTTCASVIKDLLIGTTSSNDNASVATRALESSVLALIGQHDFPSKKTCLPNRPASTYKRLLQRLGLF